MVFVWIIIGLVAFVPAVVILFFLLAAISVIPVDTKRLYTDIHPYYRWLKNTMNRFIIVLGRVHVHTEGLELLPTGTRFLLVSNHRSKFDPLCSEFSMNYGDMVYISKPENLAIPIGGRLIRRNCFLPIDRSDPRSSLKTLHHAADLMKNDTASVCVYPEGTRSKECLLLPYHDGVFKIAKYASVPVAVMTVTGTELVHKNFPWHSTDVYLTVCGVIPADYVAANTSHAIADLARKMTVEQLNKEKR